MNSLRVVLFLMFSLSAFGQIKTWTGNSTNMYPSFATNAIMIGRIGTNNVVSIDRLTVTNLISGSVTGSATVLQTPRAINGVSFDGSAPITVTAAAGTLTGSTLPAGVTGSSLTSAAGGTFGTAAFTASTAYATAAQGTTADSAAQKSANLSDLTSIPTARTTLAVQPYGRVTFSNADATVAATTVYLGQVGTMSAPRTVTLPAANAVPAGWELVVADESGTISAANTITFTRAGADAINGATTLTMLSPYGWRRFISNGSNAWAFDGGMLRAGNNLSDVASASTARTNLGLGTLATQSGTFSGTSSGTNTGDQTNITGNAATVTTNANLTGPITSVGNATAIASQTGTGTKFVVDTSPTLVTPTLGVASSTSESITGTGGAGFSGYVAQSSAPSAPAGGYRLYADAPGRLSWIRQSDGYSRTFDATLTANRVYTLPDSTMTFARTDAAQTFTGLQTLATALIVGDSTLRAVNSDLGGAIEVASQSSIYAAHNSDSGIGVFDQVLDVGSGAGLVFRRARGTFASPADVANSDQIGYTDYRPYYGTNFWQTASIAAHVDDIPVSGKRPASRLVFSTNPNNVGSTERMRIDKNGYVYINQVGQSFGADVVLTVKQNAATADFTQTIQGGTTSGSSYGLKIAAGTTSADYGLIVQNTSNSTELFRVKGNGDAYVGGIMSIGALTSLFTLDVEAVSATQQIKSTTGVNVAYTDYVNTGGIFRLGRERSSGGGLLSGSLAYAGVITVQSAHPLQFGTGSAVRQTITSAGDVGIGTAIPGSKLEVVGDITFSNLNGATTSTTRAAGKVGERMSSVIASGSAVSLTTATTANVTSVTLTPGNWIVWGKVNFTDTGTTGTDYKYGQSTSSATLGTDPTYGEIPLVTTVLTGSIKENIPLVSYSVTTSSTTQVFLVAQATFTAGTVGAYGGIYALRTD